MAAKIIFLDIDGVLNSDEWFVSKEYYSIMAKRDDEYHRSEFDPKAVARLNNIIKRTDAKIVVSSAWRCYDNIKEILKVNGIKGKMIGQTRDLDLELGYAFTGRIPRGLEIREWLSENYERFLSRPSDTLAYCILDDVPDMLLSQKEYFVHTDKSKGLTDDLVEKAVGILNSLYETKNEEENIFAFQE